MSAYRGVFIAALAAAVAASVFPHTNAQAPGNEARQTRAAQDRIKDTVSLSLSPATLRALEADRAYVAGGEAQRLGMMIAKLDDWEKTQVLEKLAAMESELDSPAARAVLGKAYGDLGNSAKAAEIAKKILDSGARGNNAEALMWAAHTMKTSGNRSEANKAARMAYQLDPRNTEAESWAKLPDRRGFGGSDRLEGARHTSHRGWKADRSLSWTDQKQLNDTLLLMGKTKTGQKVLMSVMDKSNPVVDIKNIDLQQLHQQGKVKIIKGPVSGGKPYEIREGDGVEVTHAIVMTPELLKNPAKYLAPVLGKSIDNVSYWRRFKESFSSFWMNVSGTMNKIWLSLELGAGEAPRPTPVTRQTDYETNVIHAGSFPSLNNPQKRSYEDRYGKDYMGHYDIDKINSRILARQGRPAGGLDGVAVYMQAMEKQKSSPNFNQHDAAVGKRLYPELKRFDDSLGR